MWKSEHRFAFDRRGLRDPSDLTDAEWALKHERPFFLTLSFFVFDEAQEVVAKLRRGQATTRLLRRRSQFCPNRHSGPAMTLANVRAIGVHSVDASHACADAALRRTGGII